jgi:hypothetical protein
MNLLFVFFLLIPALQRAAAPRLQPIRVDARDRRTLRR